MIRSTLMPWSRKKASARRQKAMAVGWSFVGENFGVGEAAVAVDGGVDEGVADGRFAGPVGARPSDTAVDSPAASLRYSTQLLDVLVDELAGAGHLDPTDRGPRGPVEVIEPVEPVTHQHPVDRRRRHPHNPGDPSWTKPFLDPQTHDPPLH